MANADFSRIKEAINVLINIKNLFRETLPTFVMDEINIQKIKSDLIKLNKIILELNEKFGIDFLISQNEILNFEEIFKEIFLIVNSSKNRKKLIDLGLNSTQILATGGSITISDIKTLNPNISEHDLNSFKNKIQKFWKILNTRLQQGKFKKVFLILEEENVADNILSKMKKEFEKKVSITVQILTIASFDQLSPELLSSLIK